MSTKKVKCKQMRHWRLWLGAPNWVNKKGVGEGKTILDKLAAGYNVFDRLGLENYKYIYIYTVYSYKAIMCWLIMET